MVKQCDVHPQYHTPSQKTRSFWLTRPPLPLTLHFHRDLRSSSVMYGAFLCMSVVSSWDAYSPINCCDVSPLHLAGTAESIRLAHARPKLDLTPKWKLGSKLLLLWLQTVKEALLLNPYMWKNKCIFLCPVNFSSFHNNCLLILCVCLLLRRSREGNILLPLMKRVNGHTMLLLVLYFKLITVYVCVCVSPSTIAEHCGLSLPVWKDGNEPRCMMGSVFVGKLTHAHASEIHHINPPPGAWRPSETLSCQNTHLSSPQCRTWSSTGSGRDEELGEHVRFALIQHS